MRLSSLLVIATVLTAAPLLVPDDANACGGFFCSAQNPVNQSAEQIIFVEHENGTTVSAVVQIQYQGPSEAFAWVLPVPGIPDIDISSNTALLRLAFGTRPEFELTTELVNCEDGQGPYPEFPSPLDSAGGDGDGDGDGDVMVLESGSVGPYDYDVIQPNPALADPAAEAVQWLGDNGYDVSNIGPDVLRPYLEEGLNLLAFRLLKTSNAGDIRPVVLTYETAHPMIPIRPTAVAANNDMGVLVWHVAANRSVPLNYPTMELNEARIDWANFGFNYLQVLSDAADEAGGHGFVTEMSGDAAAASALVWNLDDESAWDTVVSGCIDSWAHDSTVCGDERHSALLWAARDQYQSYDGFLEVIRETLPPPMGVSVEELLDCVECYYPRSGYDIEGFDDDAFLLALEGNVVEPMRLTRDLVAQRPHITRHFTLLSPDEMTLDPSFAPNAELEQVVDRVHRATRLYDCATETGVIQLSSGELLQSGYLWPELDDTPALARAIQHGEAGMGVVVLDNQMSIAMGIEGHNAQVTPPGGPDPEPDNGVGVPMPTMDCACALPGRARPSTGLLALALFGLLIGRRRRAATT